MYYCFSCSVRVYNQRWTHIWADIWILLIYRYRPKWSASEGVDKALLYSSRIQTTCARKHNEASQNSYLGNIFKNFSS